jgi:hypothetical protein
MVWIEVRMSKGDGGAGMKAALKDALQSRRGISGYDSDEDDEELDSQQNDASAGAGQGTSDEVSTPPVDKTELSAMLAKNQATAAAGAVSSASTPPEQKASEQPAVAAGQPNPPSLGSLLSEIQAGKGLKKTPPMKRQEVKSSFLEAIQAKSQNLKHVDMEIVQTEKEEAAKQSQSPEGFNVEMLDKVKSMTVGKKSAKTELASDVEVSEWEDDFEVNSVASGAASVTTHIPENAASESVPPVQTSHEPAVAAGALASQTPEQTIASSEAITQEPSALTQPLAEMSSVESPATTTGQQTLAQQAANAAAAAGVNSEGVRAPTDSVLTPEEIQADINQEKDEFEEDERNIDQELQEIEDEEDRDEEQSEQLGEEAVREELQEELEEQRKLTESVANQPQFKDSPIKTGQKEVQENSMTPARRARMEEMNREIAEGKSQREMEAAQAMVQPQNSAFLSDAKIPTQTVQTAAQIEADRKLAQSLQKAQGPNAQAVAATQTVQTAAQIEADRKLAESLQKAETLDSPAVTAAPANSAATTPQPSATNQFVNDVRKPKDLQSGDRVFFGGTDVEQRGLGAGARPELSDFDAITRDSSEEASLSQQPGLGAGARPELSDFDAITDAIQSKVLIPQQLALYSEYYKSRPELLHDRKLEDLQKFREEVLATDQGRTFVENAMRDPEFQKEMQRIEIDGYRSVNQKFAQGPNKQFHDIAWPAASASVRSSTIKNPQGQEVCKLTEETISQPSNFTLADGTARPVRGYRKINFPIQLDQPNGPMHLEMALKGEDGRNMPEDGAVYFTAHYNKDGQLTEVSSPIPVKFMGKGDDAIGYIERTGPDGQKHVYTLPVTQGNYRDMMQEVARNNGLGMNMSQGMAQSAVLSRDLSRVSPIRQQTMSTGVNPNTPQQTMSAVVNPNTPQQTMMHSLQEDLQKGQDAMQTASLRLRSMQMSAPQRQAQPTRLPAPFVDEAIARLQAQVQQKQAVVAEIKSEGEGGKKQGSPTESLKKAEKAATDIEQLNSRKIQALEKLLDAQRERNPGADLTGVMIDMVMRHKVKDLEKLVDRYNLGAAAPSAEILSRSSGQQISAQELVIPRSEAEKAIDQLRAQVWQERAKLADMEIAKKSMASSAGVTSDPIFKQMEAVRDIELLNARKIDTIQSALEKQRQQKPGADLPKELVDSIMKQGMVSIEQSLGTMTLNDQQVFRFQSQSALQLLIIPIQQAPKVDAAIAQLQAQMWSKQADLAKMRTDASVDAAKLAKAEKAFSDIEQLNSRKILALQLILEGERAKNPQADLKVDRIDRTMRSDLAGVDKLLGNYKVNVKEMIGAQGMEAVASPVVPTTTPELKVVAPEGVNSTVNHRSLLYKELATKLATREAANPETKVLREPPAVATPQNPVDLTSVMGAAKQSPKAADPVVAQSPSPTSVTTTPPDAAKPESPGGEKAKGEGGGEFDKNAGAMRKRSSSPLRGPLERNSSSASLSVEPSSDGNLHPPPPIPGAKPIGKGQSTGGPNV